MMPTMDDAPPPTRHVTDYAAVFEVIGSAAFVAGGFLVSPVVGCVATGAVCWVMAAFGGRKRGRNGDPE